MSFNIKIFLFWYVFLLICSFFFILKVIYIFVFLWGDVIVNWLKYFIGLDKIIIYLIVSLWIGMRVVILIDEDLLVWLKIIVLLDVLIDMYFVFFLKVF